MYNVGGMELLFIAIVALVILGPDKLPGAIRQIGQLTGELRRLSKGFQTDLKGALEESERQAEQEKAAASAASAAGPLPSTPDPGAARAAAEVELAAAEAARTPEASPAAGTSEDPVGSEGLTMSEEPSGNDSISGGGDATSAAS